MSITNKLSTLCLCLTILTFSANANDKRLDCYSEVGEIFGSSASGDMIWNGKGERFSVDYTTKIAGDFSVVYTSDSILEKEIGFMAPSYASSWNIGPEWELHFSIKSTNSQPTKWGVSIIDEKGGKATSNLDAVTSNNWQDVVMKAADFEASYTKFDFKKLVACQFTVKMPQGQKIWFDNIYFVRKDKTVLGVVEKTIEQRIKEAEESKEKRVYAAMIRAQTKSPKTVLNAYFAKLYLDREVEEINKKLYIIFTTKNTAVKKQFGLSEPWHPYLDSMLFRIYFTFNRMEGKFPRLTRETEQALLDLIWERNRMRNDIHLAQTDPWQIVNGESIDLCFKSSALLSSQIFKSLPEYSTLPYFDTGKGGGFGYWFHSKLDVNTIGPEGRATPDEGGKLYSEEHYNQWVKFFKQYLSERAKKGFFIENASPVYAKYMVNYIYDIYDYCQDSELKSLAKEFLNLYWADWIQDSIAGNKGGVKIKEYAELDSRVDSTSLMLQYELGGEGTAEIVTINQLLSDYQLPPILWELALDREGIGEFAYISRRPGESEASLPKPLGTERTFLCNTESKIVRYSWVTPDYVMGCRMTNPLAVLNHLSSSPIWHGVQFNTSPKAMVMPRAIESKNEGNWNLYKQSGYFRSVQHENVMITQQARSYTLNNPAWFLDENDGNLPIGVYFGSEPDRLIEKRGWIFIQEGNSYLAVRPVRSYYEAGESQDYLDDNQGIVSRMENRSYEWNVTKTIAKISGNYTPIIFEAGRVADYPTLQSFAEHIEDAKITLLNGVVPGAYSVVYKTTDTKGRPLEIYFNAANNEIPMINGQYINYSPEKLFDSPYMQSLYNSGITNVMRGSKDLTISFF